MTVGKRGAGAASRPLMVIFLLAFVPVGTEGQDGGAAWMTVKPGGATGCGLGAPFEYWVRESDPAKLLIYLQGGGACWSLESCDPRRAIAFDSSIDSTDYRQRTDGVFDRRSPANPFRTYSAIFIPYCTGDFHLGARRVLYPAPAGDSLGGVAVNHLGWHNVQAVIDYVASRRVKPRVVVVIGASAGAVASPVVAAELAARLPGAEIRQIGDGAGGIRLAATRTMLRHWGADSAIAAHGTPLPQSGDALTGLYIAAATREPHIRFSQVNTATDATVSLWLGRFGADSGKVASNTQAAYDELRAAGLCFSGYLRPGTQHTSVWRPGFLTIRDSGQLLVGRIDKEVVQPRCGVRRASEPAPASGGDAAFLFAYRAKPGMAAAFAEGYARHLEWHARHQDSLTWLAWSVVDGPALGAFVDGAFGLTFKAFDDRVDPRGDAEDGVRNVTAFADPLLRETYRLRRDLGWSVRLERGEPAPLQKVVRLTLRPDGIAAFEAALRSVRDKIRDRLALAVYERVSGGSHPGFMLAVQFKAWADLENSAADPSRLLLRDAASSIAHAESEVWLYRPELTYKPKR